MGIKKRFILYDGYSTWTGPQVFTTLRTKYGRIYKNGRAPRNLPLEQVIQPTQGWRKNALLLYGALRRAGEALQLQMLSGREPDMTYKNLTRR